MAKNYKLNQYLRCIVGYVEFNRYRTLHFAVRCDSLDSFTKMVQDTFVHPDINFVDTGSQVFYQRKDNENVQSHHAFHLYSLVSKHEDKVEPLLVNAHYHK